MGVRPLFYTEQSGRFVFGSEIKSLFVDPSIPKELDLEAIDQAFTFWFPLAPRSGFVGIQELPPGYTMSVTEQGLTKRCYWRLRYPSLAESNGPLPHSEKWYAENLLELLDDAVRIRLRADVPVGAYLSGGLDSSIITRLPSAILRIN
jgi:asparagine synthase (glutamine-hydrolysing)